MYIEIKDIMNFRIISPSSNEFNNPSNQFAVLINISASHMLLVSLNLKRKQLVFLRKHNFIKTFISLLPIWIWNLGTPIYKFRSFKLNTN